MGDPKVPTEVRSFDHLAEFDAARLPLYTSSGQNIGEQLKDDTSDDSTYPTIVYKSVGFKLPGVASAMALLLSSSPQFLHDPNNSNFLKVELPKPDTVISPENRKGLNKFMSPLCIIESVNELSQNFGRFKIISQRIWWNLKLVDVNFSNDFYSFEAHFQTGVAEHKTYQYHYSNSVWLLYEGDISLVGVLTDGQLLDSKVVLVFIQTFFMDNDVFTRGSHPPIWTSDRGIPCAMNAVMKRVRCIVHFAKTDRNLQMVTKWTDSKSENLKLLYVGKVSQFARGQRMISIPDRPDDVEMFSDSNVTPLFDRIIKPSLFDTLQINDMAIESKFSQFMQTQLSMLLIGGPPGAGKTELIVKMAFDYVKHGVNDRKVLICAASNNAVDVIFLMLCKMKKASPHDNVKIWRTGKELRFNPDVTSIVVKITKTYADNLKNTGVCLPPDQLVAHITKDANIVCCTYGATQQRDFTENRAILKFDTAIFDESPLAKLTEFFLPFHLTSLRRIILLGDPLQLGPTFNSPLAAKFPQTETVMFNRLSKYMQTHNRGAIIALNNQYRMRPLVASTINIVMEHSADNRLTTPNVTNAKWQLTRDDPAILIFSGQSWEEAKYGGSHSYINENEARFGVELLKALQIRNSSRTTEITYGIICMYREQVSLFKRLLKGRVQTKNVSIGTIDELQGSEFHYTIISSVRSSKQQLGFSFAADEKRLNVALSRGSCVYILAKFPAFKTKKRWNKLFHCLSKIDCVYSNADELLKFDNTGKIQENLIGVVLSLRVSDDALMVIDKERVDETKPIPRNHEANI